MNSRALAVSAVVMVACATDRDPAQAVGQRDAAVQTERYEPVLPACEWDIAACAEHIEWRFETLVQASDVAADARFVAIGGLAVGVSSDGGHSVLRLHIEEDLLRYGDTSRRWALPDSVVTLVDVVDGVVNAGEPATVYALGCRQKAAECSLWQVSADAPSDAVLEEVEGSAFEGDVSALLFDVDQRQPCVLAQGLFCFDGGWHEDITADNELREVAIGNSTSIAVAAHGAYWTRRSVPAGQAALPWEREDTGADVTWTGASDIYTGYFLIGEQGAFMQNLPGANALCSHTSDFVASSGSVLVTKDGDVLFGLNEGRCLLQTLGAAEIIGSTTVYCRASQNPLLLTEQRVLGTTYCVRL